jgi:hypothetical protein
MVKAIQEFESLQLRHLTFNFFILFYNLGMKFLFLFFFFNQTAYSLVINRDVFCADQTFVNNLQVSKSFRVEGAPPHPALVSTVAQLMDEYKVPGPLVLHFTDAVGPRKVWSLALSKEKHIYFAKNAVDLLLGIELEKVANEVCRKDWRGKKTFEIVYTNTVLEQFLRHTGTKESLSEVIQKKTGLRLRGNPGEPHFEVEMDFRTEELVTLIKQLSDLPSEVFSKMKLKRLSRYRYGADLPKESASGIYIEKDEIILLCDKAFMDNIEDVYGEGTLLHEMGHAYWYGTSESLRIQFLDISWVKKGNDWEKKTDRSEAFISEYAMTKPEEDFAEHFSGYVHQPEYLKKLAQIKHDFFHKNIFTDTTYFSTVAKNAKVFIESPVPDTKKPWLEKSLGESFSTSIRVNNPSTQASEVAVEVTGARDDISGIAPTLQVFEHEKNSKYRVFVDLNPVAQAGGSFSLKGVVQTNPSKLAPGIYQPSTFSLRDMAGNREYYETKALKGIHLHGLLSIEEVAKEEIDFSKIKIEEAMLIQGFPGVKVTLPLNFKESMEYIHLNWEFTGLEGKTTHVCHFKAKPLKNSIPCYAEAKPGEPIKLQLYFYKSYPSSLIKLASFVVHYMGTEATGKTRHSYTVPFGVETASARIETGHNNLDQLDLGVNDMKLAAVTQTNSDGGDQNIAFSIPLVNRPAGEFEIYINVRSPSGVKVSALVSESSKKKKYEIVRINEIDYINFHLPLKKNPEEGEYIVESFELRTKHSSTRPQGLYLPLDLDGLAVQKIKLLERGIKKTFTISDEKIIRHN